VANLDENDNYFIDHFISVVIAAQHKQEVKMTTIFESIVPGVIASYSSFEWIMSTTAGTFISRILESWHGKSLLRNNHSHNENAVTATVAA